MFNRSAFWRAAGAAMILWAPHAQGAAAWFNASWTNRLAITIDSAKVSGSLTNFPVLINITNSSLQQLAQSDADDILFTSADGTTKLSHEIESYISASGALAAWVKVPGLSPSSNTVLYLYFRNPAAASQQNAAGVWDSNFKGVWHLSESSGTFYDSTANNCDGIDNVSAAGKTGKVGSGQQFDGWDDYINTGTQDPSTGDLTLSVWARWNGANGRHQVLLAKRDTWATNDMRWEWVRDYSISSLWVTSLADDANFMADLPDTTTWHLFVMTRSGTTCTL